MPEDKAPQSGLRPLPPEDKSRLTHIMKRDSQIFDLIGAERKRQTEGIELIASENYVSDQVMEAMGSVLTNKYAEGYPGARYYGGCEVVDPFM